MLKSKLEELRKEYVGEEIELLDLEGIDNFSLDYIFPDHQVYNLELGEYIDKMKGSYSYQHEDCDENEEINFIFETVGEWEVVDNTSYSNINITKIDVKSIIIKIIDIEII